MIHSHKIHKPTKLTIEHYDNVVSAEVPWVTNLDDIMQVFEGMIVAIGFSKNSLDDWAKERVEELNNYESFVQENQTST